MEFSGQLYAPAALPPTERAPGTLRIGGWLGGGKEKNFQPPPGLEPLIIEPVGQTYNSELSQLLISLVIF
jgi:hypothetical protein